MNFIHWTFNELLFIFSLKCHLKDIRIDNSNTVGVADDEEWQTEIGKQLIRCNAIGWNRNQNTVDGNGALSGRRRCCVYLTRSRCPIHVRGDDDDVRLCGGTAVASRRSPSPVVTGRWRVVSETADMAAAIVRRTSRRRTYRLRGTRSCASFPCFREPTVQRVTTVKSSRPNSNARDARVQRRPRTIVAGNGTAAAADGDDAHDAAGRPALSRGKRAIATSAAAVVRFAAVSVAFRWRPETNVPWRDVYRDPIEAIASTGSRPSSCPRINYPRTLPTIPETNRLWRQKISCLCTPPPTSLVFAVNDTFKTLLAHRILSYSLVRTIISAVHPLVTSSRQPPITVLWPNGSVVDNSVHCSRLLLSTGEFFPTSAVLYILWKI